MVEVLATGTTFFTDGIDVLRILVQGLGAAYAVVGLINMAQGHSSHNAAKKEEGIGQFVGGGSIFLIGTLLIPKLSQFFSM